MQKLKEFWLAVLEAKWLNTSPYYSILSVKLDQIGLSSHYPNTVKIILFRNKVCDAFLYDPYEAHAKAQRILTSDFLEVREQPPSV